MCDCVCMCTVAASEQQHWRKAGYTWAWPLCALMGVIERRRNCSKTASKNERSQKGAISRVKKEKKNKTPCVCSRSPAIWTPPSPPSSPFPLLLSPDWCAIHGGPISPFSVLCPLATIHANEVEQITFLLWVHACVPAFWCVCMHVGE